MFQKVVQIPWSTENRMSYFLNSVLRWPMALEKLKSSQRHKSTSSAGAWGLATSSFTSSCRFRWFPLLRFPVFGTCVLRTHHAWWWTHDISGKRSPKNRSTSYRLIPEKMGGLLGLHEKRSLKRRNWSHYRGLLRRPGLPNYLHWPHGAIQAKTQCFAFITLIATVQGFKADKAVGLANCWASHGPTQLLRNRWAT